jgi:hypothetical protein
MAPRPSSPPSAQPPPDLPSMPGESQVLVGYLRNFALWCRHGFAAKLDAQTALPGVLLQAYDAAPGTTPAVWLVQVNTAGLISTVAQPLGTGKP